MKPDARQIPRLLADPSSLRAVLLYGDDEGLLRERAQSLTRAVAGSLNDAFRVSELGRDGWSSLPAEQASLSLMGGRRVVRVREVSDSILPYLVDALRGKGEALMILEAAGLGRGKLRSFAEADPACAAIACYPEEGRALQTVISSGLEAAGAKFDAAALPWLAERLAGDGGMLRGDIEKLALLAGPGGTVDVALARDLLDDAASGGEDAVLLACQGDLDGADSALEAVLAESSAAIMALRMAIQLLQRLHQARLRMEAGMSQADAIKAIRPPVFYKSIPAMSAALSLWSEASLRAALDEARAVELASKQTGSRPDLLVRRYVAGLARHARARKARRGGTA